MVEINSIGQNKFSNHNFDSFNENNIDIFPAEKKFIRSSTNEFQRMAQTV